MSSVNITVEMVEGVFPSEDRAVAFLCGHDDLTADPKFKKESKTPLAKRLKHRMSLWIAKEPDQKGKYHRFKNEDPKYR